MPATLKDVAKLAKVSVATASLALKNKPVSAKARAAVFEAAKKLNYVAGSAGLSLKSGKSFSVGLYILNSRTNRDLTNECSYFYAMLKGVLEETAHRNYSFNFEIGYWEDIEKNNFILDKAYSRSIDGAIIVPQYSFHYSFLKALEDLSFPYVICNPMVNIDPAKTVTVNNYQGAFLAVRFLAERGKRRIAVINGPKNHYDAMERAKGFNEAVVRLGLTIVPEYIAYGDFTIAGGYGAAVSMLDSAKDHPDGIFCANDYMAAGAIRALNERGLKVPGDVSIVGFDDTDISKGLSPSLTTVKNPTFETGKKAAERLFCLIENPDAAYEPIVLEPQIVERESTS